MLKIGSPVNGNPEIESNDTLRFLKSLQELRELRSQIHYAADYCEKSFLKAEDKASVVDNTKEYLCRAVVTVVDHLGSVSANLNRRIENSDRVSETELRINSLKQKLDSCDQYNQNFTLTKLRWSPDLPRYYPRYISPPSNSSNKNSSLQLREVEPNKPTDGNGVTKHEFKTDEDMPLFMYTSSNKINLDTTSPTSPLDIDVKGIIVMPVGDIGFSVAVPKLIRNPSFHFQENKKVNGIRRILHRKSMDDNDIGTVVRRRKREPFRFLLKLKS